MESVSSKSAISSNSTSNGTKSKFGCKNGTKNSKTSTNQQQCTKSTDNVSPAKSLPTVSSTINNKAVQRTKTQKLGTLETTKQQPTLVKMQSKENRRDIVNDEQLKCTTNPFIQLLSTTTETEDSKQNGGNSPSNRLQISGDDGVEDDQNPFGSNDTCDDDSEDVIVRKIDDEDKVNENCEGQRQEYDDDDEGVIADMNSCTDSLPKMFDNLHLNRTQLHNKIQETPTQNTSSCDEFESSSKIHNNESRNIQHIEGIYSNDICHTATISQNHNNKMYTTENITIPLTVRQNPILNFPISPTNPIPDSISQLQLIPINRHNKCASMSHSSSTTTNTSSSSPTSSSLSPTSSYCNLLIPTINSTSIMQCSSSPPIEAHIGIGPSCETVYYNSKLIKTRQFPAKTQSLDLASDDDDHHSTSLLHLHHNRHPHYNHQHQHQNQLPNQAQYHNMHCIIDKRTIPGERERDNADIDADVDEDDDAIKIETSKSISHTSPLLNITSGHCSLRRSLLQRNSICSNSSGSTGIGDNHELSQNDLTNIPNNTQKTTTSIETRPIYPNVPYSPYGSPFGSPRSNRRRAPLRESRRISIEKSGSFLQLNQYKLMDQIGQGSYGLVKLAYSEEDSTHYAMKILSKRRLLRKAGLMGRGPKTKKATSPLDRVYREIAVLKKLDHPNVVKLTEVLDDPLEDSLYLVFELVQQGEVLSIPTDKPLPEQRAWGVFRDALLGLEYLHYQRIIHADIKPGNLLLAECGRVKIADLGVCNEFLGEDAVMNNGSTAGTPAFRAPETLIPGQHIYSGKAADIWALGATLYSLVYGNVPFVASSVPVVYERIKNDSLNFPEKPIITSDLKDLIEKMLNKDPTNRITLPQIKQHPWVTSNGSLQLPTEEENCRLVQINDEDINSVVKSIPKLDTLILIKTMLKNHSFQNPFMRGISGRAPQPGGSRLERFSRSGRSNSAPGAYHLPPDRQLSSDNILPALSESVASSNNDSSDHD